MISIRAFNNALQSHLKTLWQTRQLNPDSLCLSAHSRKNRSMSCCPGLFSSFCLAFYLCWVCYSLFQCDMLVQLSMKHEIGNKQEEDEKLQKCMIKKVISFWNKNRRGQLQFLNWTASFFQDWNFLDSVHFCLTRLLTTSKGGWVA